MLTIHTLFGERILISEMSSMLSLQILILLSKYLIISTSLTTEFQINAKNRSRT